MNSQKDPNEDKSIADVLTEFKVQTDSGLTNSEVHERQKTYGLNEVPEEKPSMLLVFLKHFLGLTPFMLEFTIVVSFLLRKYIDVYLISGLMLFNAIVSFIQERKATKTVAALKGSLQVAIRVLRNKKWQQIKGNQIVPGDIVRFRTGDLIVADAKLIDGETGVDQSALTGESKLNNKKNGDVLYAGSIIKNGECTAVIVATGIKTFFGKTAELVQKAKPRLHMDDVVANVVKILIIIVLVFLTMTVVVSLMRGETFLSILPLLLILLISAVPVALPAMFTVSMAKGSQELAAVGVLVSRLSATEDAATMTTLCIDKTGTLTENRLSVQEVIAARGFTVTEVLQYAVLASVTANNDPIDMAFIQKAFTEHIDMQDYKQVSFVPFTAAAKRTEAVVQKDSEQFTVLKGAYDTLMELCRHKTSELDKTVEIWAGKGFKTMAVAVKHKNTIKMVGIAALIDPPLPDAAEMIAKIKELGVKVKMLTGDALPIAKEIAIEVGVGRDIVSARLLRNKSNADSNPQMRIGHDGFAEVLPEDKFNIVSVLQQRHEITGMTGDGVNDAPALKQAEVGIAVKSATDVAKQAASVILLKEGLESIISLITVGRTIHHRITNWVVSKISKTLFTVIFVCSAYLITGQFIVDAMDMIMLLFLLDFVALTLSTDRVNWSQKPESWALKPLAKKGFVLGLLCTAEALLWLFIGEKYLGITQIDQLHSFGFAILFFTGIFNIVIVRTKKRFYQQGIGSILLFAIIADIILVLLMLTMNIPGFAVLSDVVTASTLLYFLICGLVINDWVKSKS
ncbi:MAG: plasma-membrane proton-efflux P-type ATPase [Candidatus Pedobacter colombiensis]|uniref:Plasma-membrane proton-efflux P-type ATPase n=1 Tax=Candidatus Pedobacter colombiensis TaxID=3121371 RepID=A0AAJ6B909_9SPHI|nr:plasma-membrane proton-efflux P-type ATPase [Pedobacter sp.]WEK21046.1 MAG: plasma-membrane proton-efflux P-type ATPase [Pedobacter sp.]